MLCAIAGSLVVGLLASFSGAGITDLVVELGNGPVADPESRAVQALGDPSLEVGYWYAEGRRVRRLPEGREVALPGPARSVRSPS